MWHYWQGCVSIFIFVSFIMMTSPGFFPLDLNLSHHRLRSMRIWANSNTNSNTNSKSNTKTELLLVLMNTFSCLGIELLPDV